MYVHPVDPDSEHELQRLRRAARCDPLTGAANRLELQDRLDAALAAFRIDASPFAVLFLDVDDFKTINDRHGHSAGDRTLIGLAETLRRESDAADLVARYGGDEFLVVRPGCNGDAARKHAERLRTVIAEQGVPSHLSRLSTLDPQPATPFTVSIGVAVVEPGDDLDSLLQRADRALYRAKDAGRNCVR